MVQDYRDLLRYRKAAPKEIAHCILSLTNWEKSLEIEKAVIQFYLIHFSYKPVVIYKDT
jgi:hypothetical protein